ncbi:hypothetical protein KY290_027799 [Solanum tuberosum]|uniref:Endo-1,4-beta-glucanase n=2 Tax=Solanum tuberosum TaxID=4113 RepID=M1AQT7_SOLTU|nr:hypothetical protein KY285_026781 [Solanum tuberosum]KAH0748567.1 hypothetical protein KY290_027799 [Solanum tuberosum]
MVIDQAKFRKLLDDMEHAASNLKFAHFKDNLKHLHYISLLSLAYFVGSSTRIVRLNKWVSVQRLKDNVQMPRTNNVSLMGNYGLQDGGCIDLIMFKHLVVVNNDAGDGLQLSLPLFCVLIMLSWSVSEHLANFEVVVELDHIRVVSRATYIMTSILRILWPRGHLEKLQDFSCHNHVQQAVNYVDTIYKAWYEALDFSRKGLAGACRQMYFVQLKVNVTAPRLPMLSLARSFDLNLEDKVLIED